MLGTYNRFLPYFLGQFEDIFSNAGDVTASSLHIFTTSATRNFNNRAVPCPIFQSTTIQNNYASWYADSTANSLEIVYPSAFDLSDYNIDLYFLTDYTTSPSTATPWTLENTQAVNANSLFDVSVESGNKLAIKLKANYPTYNDLDSAWYKITNPSTNVNSFLVPWFTPKTPAQTVTVTNVDNTAGFTLTALPASCNVGTGYTITATPTSGYTVTTTPHVAIVQGGNTIVDTDLTLSGGVYSTTVTFTTAGTATATYTGTATAPVQTVTVTNVNNITGLTVVQLLPSSCAYNTTYEIIVDVPDYVTVTTTPHVVLYDNDAQTTIGETDLVLTGNRYSQTITFRNTARTNITATYTGVGRNDLIPVTIENNMQGFELTTPFPNNIVRSTQYTTTITLPMYYEITTAPQIMVYDQNNDRIYTGSFTDNGNGTYSATYRCSITTVTAVKIVYSGVSADHRRYLPNVTIDDETIHFTDIPTELTLREDTTTTVTIHNESGYPYTIIPPYATIYWREQGISRTYEGVRINATTWQIFIVIGDFGDNLPSSTTVKFWGEASEETELANMNPFVDTFKISKTDLEGIMNVRFISKNDNDKVDLTEFVLNLYKPYVVVSTLATSSSVFLGWISTGRTAPLVKFAYTEVEFSFNVNKVYNNSLDYKADITLYVPFHGLVKLNAGDVMGQVLTGTYRINNVTGEGVCYLYTGGKLFNAVKCKVKYETCVNQVSGGNLKEIAKSIDDSNEYCDLNPKLYISRPIPISTNYNTFNNADERTTLLTKGAGKYSIDYIELSTLATDSEVDEIKQLLKNEVEYLI